MAAKGDEFKIGKRKIGIVPLQFSETKRRALMGQKATSSGRGYIEPMLVRVSELRLTPPAEPGKKGRAVY